MTEPPDPAGPSPWRPPPPGSPESPGSPASPGSPWARRPDAPHRFSGGGVVVGLLAYLPWILLTVVLTGFATGLVSNGSGPNLSGAAISVILLVAGLAPVVVGVVLAARPGSPWWRGFGLGLAIGWAVWGIVGAGVCVAVLAVLPSLTS